MANGKGTLEYIKLVNAGLIDPSVVSYAEWAGLLPYSNQNYMDDDLYAYLLKLQATTDRQAASNAQYAKINADRQAAFDGMKKQMEDESRQAASATQYANINANQQNDAAKLAQLWDSMWTGTQTTGNSAMTDAERQAKSAAQYAKYNATIQEDAAKLAGTGANTGTQNSGTKSTGTRQTIGANTGVGNALSNAAKSAGQKINNAVSTVKNTANAIGQAQVKPAADDDGTPKPGNDNYQPTVDNGTGTGSPTSASTPTNTPTTSSTQQTVNTTTQPMAQTLQPIQGNAPYDAPPAAYDPASYAAYQQALNVLLDAQGNAPTYTNPYETQLQNAYDAIVNRPKFNYDLNEDMLYRQYAQNYQNLGRLAMQDTMGQAAALTGGYGSSYGQAVGQQQYNAYLQQLNNIVPELYQQAYQQYRDEGNDLLNQYSILDAMADKDYNRYQDDYNRWLNERNYAADMENQAYNRGYSAWQDAQDIYNRDRAFDNQQLQADRDYQMGLAQLNYNMANSDREYQMALDKWNYQKEQDALAQAAAEQAAAGGNGGSGTRVGYDKHGYTEDMIRDLQRQAGLKETGVWGENEKQAYKAGFRATNDPNKAGNGGTGNTEGNGAGPGVTTYSEAVAYMKHNNIPLRAIDDENKTVTPDNLYTKQRWMAGKAAWLARKEGKVTGNDNPALAYDNPAFAFDSYEDYLNGMIAYSQRNM